MVTMTYKRNLRENHELNAEYIIKGEIYLCQNSSSFIFIKHLFINYLFSYLVIQLLFIQYSAPNTQRRALKREVLTFSVSQGSVQHGRVGGYPPLQGGSKRNIRNDNAWPPKLCFLCCNFINQTPPSFHPFPLMLSYDESVKILNNPLTQSPCSVIVYETPSKTSPEVSFIVSWVIGN